MMRRAPERIEIVCETCGMIAEIFQPRTAPLPRLCSCPAPRAVGAAKRPRLCIHCSTRLNRYNMGLACGPCTHTRSRASTHLP